MASGIGDPEPGDLIEIKRPLYDHWALYVGDGYVIHVTTVDGETLSRSRCRSGSAKRNKAVVRKELFEEVVRNEVWFVNNKYDYGWTPLPAEKIIQHAESWVNKEWRYGLVKKNCEHFVTMLRYGKSFSRQVSNTCASESIS
ncbi:HRSL1 enzyme, partial [Serilophus lunatus]|nr:HRSL1 enzyme [Serilophus lunatus]